MSLPPPLSKKALKLAREESRTRSELVREALREYIVRRDVVAEARRHLARRLARKGVRGLKDIERLVDEGRL